MGKIFTASCDCGYTKDNVCVLRWRGAAENSRHTIHSTTAEIVRSYLKATSVAKSRYAAMSVVQMMCFHT